MRKALCIFVLFFGFLAFISSGQNNFELSKYEKRWAFFHPCAALKIKKHRPEMQAIYAEVKDTKVLDEFENGGKLDAFRHTFAMAYFSKYVSVKKLRKLGKAHEKGNYLQFVMNQNEESRELPDSLSSVMDLKNNELGFSLAKQVKKLRIEDVKQKVIEQIQKGNAVIMKRNPASLYTDCEGNVIANEKWHKHWFIPKCIVPSKD